MELISVKRYSELIDKSDKTVYKMIQKGKINAAKVKKGYKVEIDPYLLAIVKEQADTITALKSELAKLENAVVAEPVKEVPLKKAVVKKAAVKKPIVKKRVSKSPVPKKRVPSKRK